MKRRYQILSLLILVLPLGVVGLFWNYLPEHLPMHFTVEGQPDRYGSRREWLGMLVSTTLFLALVVGLFIRFLPNRLLIHHRRTGALYLISAAFIASLTGVIILKTVLNSSLFSGLVPVLMTLFGSGLVYFTVPSFLPMTDELLARQLTPTRLVALQKIYRLTRSVVVRVNALIALVMLLTSPNSRWPIAILANLLAFLVLTVIGSHMYRKAN